MHEPLMATIPFYHEMATHRTPPQRLLLGTFLCKHGLVSKLLKNKYVASLKNCVKKSKAL